MNGYPYESILRKIKKWDGKDVWKMISWIEMCWNFTYGKVKSSKKRGKKLRYTLITGGWSGNELVMAAIEKNKWFNMLYWYKSERGGLHEYEIYEMEEEDVIVNGRGGLPT